MKNKQDQWSVFSIQYSVISDQWSVGIKTDGKLVNLLKYGSLCDLVADL